MAVDRPVAFAFSSTSSIPDVPFPVSMPAQMGGDFFLFHDPALGRRSWCSGKPYGFGEEPPSAGLGRRSCRAPARKSALPMLDIGGRNSPRPWAKLLPHLEVAIVKRSDPAKGFGALSRRWVVARTIACAPFTAPHAIRSRKRLATDWANLNREAPAFLRLASIRLMLRNLWNPTRCFRPDSKRQMPTGTNRTFEKCWPTVNSSL
jgi:hypothetical protein